MTENTDYTELIERYLDGIMETEEAKRFEVMSGLDPDLSIELKLHREIRSTVREYSIRQKLKVISHEYSRNYFVINSFSISKKHILNVCFLTVFFTGLAVVFMLMQSKKSVDEIYMANYSHFPSSFNTRSLISAPVTDQSKARSYYLSQNYMAALSYFRKIIVKNPENSEACFYAGICAMENGLFTDALSYFDKITSCQSPYKMPSVWYSGLCYLKLDNKQKAIEKFKILAKSNSLYREPSITIVEQLK